MDDLNTVKIGYKKYAIEKPQELEVNDMEFFGTYSFMRSKIKIAGKLSQDDKNHTFIHEMLHAICTRFSLKELSGDEQTVDLLALGVYEAIQDNPHIFLMADI